MFNKDYYPTPENLIYKMLNKVDMRTISSVLEPSAGKGNLVKAVNNKLKNVSYRNEKSMYDIDCIEIEPQLQHILRGEGYRVIHDDFLTFDTMKSYSLIIANFPFSEGDKHLLKCLDIQKNGGQIVCLINAETLKNPYSNTRQDLARKLEELNADIEYIQDAFSTAERKTGVEIALISISIPCNTSNSLIVEKLRQEEKQTAEHVTEANEVIHGDFIQGIVQQYNYEVKASVNLIEEYYKLQPLMLQSFKEKESRSILRLEVDRSNIGYSQASKGELINDCIKKIRSKYWEALFNNESFNQLFTNNLRQEFHSKIQELEDYDFSEYNISEIKIQINNNMKKSIESTILELFEEFSNKHSYAEYSKNIHLFNGWKSNKSWKISSRVIIPLSGFNPYDGRIEYDRTSLNKLQDIEKVFNYLDGGITDHVDMVEILKTAQSYGETKKIELKYFTVTFYKKGTCHIEFINEDLLKKFNIFGCQRKGWLPPSYGKNTYNTMSKEEKTIVDGFEGKESYNNTMSNTEYFIFNTSKLLQITA